MGFLIWLALVQLWACFLRAQGRAEPGRGNVQTCPVRAFLSCLNLMLRFDSQDEV